MADYLVSLFETLKEDNIQHAGIYYLSIVCFCFYFLIPFYSVFFVSLFYFVLSFLYLLYFLLLL